MVEQKGFALDRRWMLVDSEGKFITQRVYPQMALLRTAISKDFLEVFNIDNPQDKIQIPLDAELEETMNVQIWDDKVNAALVNSSFDKWFSQMLSMDLRLVKMPESTQRKVNPKYAIDNESVSFADGMPYLLIGQESLNDINSRIDHPVPMNRFRPSIVFSGGHPFMEDDFRSLQIGEIDFHVVKPCGRCVIITINQDTAEKGSEPLKTLATYRTVDNKVMFGQNMIATSFGELKVGDQVQLKK